jgi:hypothetical protein
LQILYGQNWHLNSLKNYRQQNSPLMFELLNVSPENEEILKIGCEKFLGWVVEVFDDKIQVLMKINKFLQIQSISLPLGTAVCNTRVPLAFDWRA